MGWLKIRYTPNKYTPNKRRHLRSIKKNQRNREKPQRILVAGRPVKEKEE